MPHHSLTRYPQVTQGKVRSLYDCGNESLLIVSSDRFSAFDTIFPQSFHNNDYSKGELLTAISKKWFSYIGSHITEVPHHYLGEDALSPILRDELLQLQSRSMVVRKVSPLPLEAVVRAYLIGSAYEEYKEFGSVCGIFLPPGLKKYSPLPEPLFTPAFKAPVGEKDKNITRKESSDLVGVETLAEIESASLTLFSGAQSYCKSRGVALLDTKFEFGILPNGNILVIDEIFTPDSSRYFLLDSMAKGEVVHYDKQYIRDYLIATSWDGKQATFPQPVIDEFLRRYHVILQRLFT